MKDYTIYVTEEIVRKALEKGFECKTINYSADLFYKELPPNFYDSYNNYFLPTAEQICGWLKEEKNIEISIGRNTLGDYPYRAIAYSLGKKEYSKVSDGFEYKTTILEIIDKALDLI